MNILQALKAEEAKFLGQMEEARQQLETVRMAIKIGKAETNGKRTLSKAGLAKIAKTQRTRWGRNRSKHDRAMGV